MDQEPRAAGGKVVQDGAGRWAEIISSLSSNGVVFQVPLYDMAGSWRAVHVLPIICNSKH